MHNRAVLSRDERHCHTYLADPRQAHAVACVELLQHLTIGTVVHPSVRKHPVHVHTQQTYSTRAFRESLLPCGQCASRDWTGTRNSQLSASVGKSLSHATSIGATRPINRSSWFAAMPSPGLLAVSISALMVAPAWMWRAATTLLPSRARTGTSAGT